MTFEHLLFCCPEVRAQREAMERPEAMTSIARTGYREARLGTPPKEIRGLYRKRLITFDAFERVWDGDGREMGG